MHTIKKNNQAMNANLKEDQHMRYYLPSTNEKHINRQYCICARN